MTPPKPKPRAEKDAAPDVFTPVGASASSPPTWTPEPLSPPNRLPRPLSLPLWCPVAAGFVAREPTGRSSKVQVVASISSNLEEHALRLVASGAAPLAFDMLLAHEALPGWSVQVIMLLGQTLEASRRVLATCRNVLLRAAEDALMHTRSVLVLSRALTGGQATWSALDEELFSRLRAWCRFMDAVLGLGFGFAPGTRSVRSALQDDIVNELDTAMAMATLRRHCGAW